MEPTDSVHRAVARQIEKLITCDRSVRVDTPDSIHQMRVIVRTVRSLIQASPSAFGLSEDASILRELKDFAAVLGSARDAEVLADRYAQALGGLPQDLVRGPIRECLVEGGRDRYRAGLDRSLEVIRSPSYFRLLDELDALIAAAPPSSRSSRHRSTRALLAGGYKRICDRVKVAASADAAQHDAGLHQIRKGAKRLRYIAAATGESDVAHQAGADTFTYGLLYQRETDFAEQCERQLHTALATLKKAVHKAL